MRQKCAIFRNALAFCLFSDFFRLLSSTDAGCRATTTSTLDSQGLYLSFEEIRPKKLGRFLNNRKCYVLNKTVLLFWDKFLLKKMVVGFDFRSVPASQAPSVISGMPPVQHKQFGEPSEFSNLSEFQFLVRNLVQNWTQAVIVRVLGFKTRRYL